MPSLFRKADAIETHDELPVPFAFATFQVCMHIDHSVYIVNHLKIKHAHAKEVRAMLQRPVETISRFNGSCSQYLERHHGNFSAFHKGRVLFRKRKGVPDFSI